MGTKKFCINVLFFHRLRERNLMEDPEAVKRGKPHRKRGNAFGGTPKAAGEDARAPQPNYMDTPQEAFI
jgi:hypothetical protein